VVGRLRNTWNGAEVALFEGRDSAVGIAPRYVEGSNPGWGDIFRTRPDRLWGPAGLLYNGYRVYPGAKAAEVWR